MFSLRGPTIKIRTYWNLTEVLFYLSISIQGLLFQNQSCISFQTFLTVLLFQWKILPSTDIKVNFRKWRFNEKNQDADSTRKLICLFRGRHSMNTIRNVYLKQRTPNIPTAVWNNWSYKYFQISHFFNTQISLLIEPYLFYHRRRTRIPHWLYLQVYNLVL